MALGEPRRDDPPVEAVSTAHLVTFLDFLYAVILGFALQQSYEILAAAIFFVEKATALLLFAAAVYFVTDDWLDARGLTQRNPYPAHSFIRFLYDLIIAFLSYGVLVYAQRRSTAFVIFIILIQIFSLLWAIRCVKDHPDTRDRSILNVTQRTTSSGILIFGLFYLGHAAYSCSRERILVQLSDYVECVKPQRLSFVATIVFVATLLLWLVLHESGKAGIVPVQGAYFGPSAPFFDHQRLRRLSERLRASPTFLLLWTVLLAFVTIVMLVVAAVTAFRQP